MRAIWLIALISIIGSYSHAADVCAAPTIQSLELKTPQGKPFTLKYRYLKGESPEAPVLIYLPGGPGGGSINAEDPRVSKQYGFIQTDPRGAQCNSSYWTVAGDDLTTSLLADDVIAIIDSLKLKRVILYGVSYGTALATVIEHKLEARGASPVEALVLEGTIARAIRYGESDANYIKQWALQTAMLSPELKEKLSQESPFGFTPRQWGGLASSLLGYGLNLQTKEFVFAEVVQMAVSQPERFAMIMKAVNEPIPADKKRIYQNIGCREFTDKWETDTYLEQGRLVAKKLPAEDDMCPGIALTNPFDVTKYPLKTRIYYFSGTHDPATRFEHTFQNARAQTGSDRVLVTVSRGGHNPLQLNLTDCNPQIWSDILMGKTDLAPTLAQCSIKARAKVLPRAGS